ncbi:hypothetical protein CQA53_09900, partial [Helicobacter didelphidarum]
EKGLLNNTTYYFCLDKDWQKEKDKGAIPEGEYYININDIKERRTIFSENTFGKNTRIYTDKDCSNTTESHTQRENFYLHGGDKYGNNGGIDIGKNDKRFFNTLETLKKEYKDILDSTQDDKGKIAIKLEVEYGEEIEFAKYFTFDEMVKTSQGQKYIDLNKKFVLDNQYPERLQSLKDLCQKILDKLQEHIYEQYGESQIYKININSGVRCKELNEKLGGSKTSQHSHCEVADIAFLNNDKNNKILLIKLYEDIYNKKVIGLKNTSIISQCIFELNSSYWIHIAISTDRWKKIKNKNKPDFLTKPKGVAYHVYNGTNLNF